MTQNIIINDELKNLLPPLFPEEFIGLEESIRKDGCLSPLVVWNDILVDGHHRYEICKKYQIPFAVKSIVLENLDDAKLWAGRHQENRRNLTDFYRAELALKLKDVVAAKAKERQRGGQGGILLPSTLTEAKETRQELAQLAGVSSGNITKAEFISEHADEETKAKLRRGEKGTSINKEYNRLKAEEKAEKKPRSKTTKKTAKSGKNTSETITVNLKSSPKVNERYSCGVKFEPDPNDDFFDWITDKERDELFEMRKTCPNGPLAQTGSGGWHLLFARPEVDLVGSKRIKWHGVKTGIDVQVGNQYIVVPPSIHPNGDKYQWHTPPCHVGELPQLPDAWIEQVLPKRQQDTPVSHTSPPVAFSYSESTSALAERCRAYVATMPPAVQGQGGHTALLKVANVIFHGFGLSESEGWPIMLEYNSRCLPPWDLGDPKEEREFRRKMNQAREKPTTDYPFGFYRDQNSCTTQQYDADISFLIENLSQQSPPIVAVDEGDDIPEHLVYVPGFIEKIVQFCLEAAPHPNRMLAFCGAIALMSFLITRKVQTRSGIRPNLYIIALAGSGTGKDFIRKVNNYILEMTGQEAMIGETIASFVK